MKPRDSSDPLYSESMAGQDVVKSVIDPNDALGYKSAFIHEIQVAGVRRALARSAGAPRLGLALDFGCGWGRLVPELLEQADRVIGLDVGAKLLDHARKVHAGRPVEFVAYDGRTIPLVPGTFDAVLSVGCIQYFVSDPRQELLLRQVAALLKPGGRIVMIEQIRTSRGRWQGTYEDYLRTFTKAGLVPKTVEPLRNGRDTLTYSVRYGLVPRPLLGAAAWLERRLAQIPAMPWTGYRDCLMVFAKP